NGKDAEEMIYKGFLTSLLQEDPYAAYYTKEEIEETRNRQKGIYKGIGAAVSEKEGGPLVEYVYPGSPAEKAGLLAGDVVLKVDGISVESLSLNYIVENLIQGLAGSSLEMVVNRNGEEVTLRITRGEVIIPGSEVGDVAEMLKLGDAEQQNEATSQNGGEKQTDAGTGVLANLQPGDIGYLSLRGFYMEAVDSFISQYESDIDGKKKALIIDLRGNPGGDVEAATKLLDYFLPDHLQKPKRKDSQPLQTQENSPETSNAQATGTEGSNTQYGGESVSPSVLEVTPNPNRQFEKDKTLLLYTEDKWGKGKDWYAKDGHEVDLPIIILMNQNSASASELFAGTMQDYDRAWVFGTLSYGKGIVQTVRSFPDGSAVEFTTHYYFTPAGRNIHKKGITPDLTVEMPEADQFTYLRDRAKDLQLRKAAESLYINFIHDKNSP
ncbi:MAG: PDZ domain-containing protein, partial [Oribacterium sinus]|nr:PDZ domain-containing protein [Oribacterium sinus]